MARMRFQRLRPDKTTLGEPFEVPYNPTEFGFSKSAQVADIAIPGLDAPVLQFVRGDTETLTLELFFDSTRHGMGSGAQPVTTELDAFYRLVKVEGALHAPPLVRITWGEHFPGQVHNGGTRPQPAFDAVVVSVARKYTLFSPDGVPLRANVTLQLKEYRTLEEQLQALNLQSADHTRVHVVQEGENLTTIAADAYADPAHWRLIARHNGLRNARDLAAGQVLELPPLPL